MTRFTRILATLGPASTDRSVLRAMLEAGMDAVRLNFSHGTHEEHRRRVEAVRAEARALGRPVAVVADLQGPKIRTSGPVPGGSIQLETGTRVTLVSRAVKARPDRLGVSLRRFASHVERGERILIDDGRLRLRVVGVRPDAVTAQVERGGRIGERRGVNLPDSRMRLTPVTAKDKRDMAFAIELDVDYIAQSFVGEAGDVRILRRHLQRLQATIPIIAKLERPRALDDLDAILDEADGVMVARGDLGVEIPLEKVPAAQKRIIARAGEKARLCITATQMLESMVHKSVPTRAEVSDVANAVFDGTDVVMLSAETAIGENPPAVVGMMARIVREAERDTPKTLWEVQPHARRPFREVLARAAAHAAHRIQARALVVLTLSGRTALRVSKLRSYVPVLAIAPVATVVRRAMLYWGVQPLQHHFVSNSDHLRASVESRLLDEHLIAPGDPIAWLGGVQPGRMAHDFLQLREVPRPRPTGTSAAGRKPRRGRR
jgi:pyruvate kinase